MRFLNNELVTINRLKTGFINNGDPNDLCYLYITKVGSLLKFGITSNLNSRMHSLRVKSLFIIFTDIRIKIAELEAEIKLNLNSDCEYFNYNFINLLRLSRVIIKIIPGFSRNDLKIYKI